MEGASFGAGRAGAALDPVSFARRPQTLLRVASWVSGPCPGSRSRPCLTTFRPLLTPCHLPPSPCFSPRNPLTLMLAGPSPAGLRLG